MTFFFGLQLKLVKLKPPLKISGSATDIHAPKIWIWILQGFHDYNVH